MVLGVNRGDVKAIVLAAGKGTRMRPYTDDTPKGMLEFDDEPLLENLRRSFEDCDVDDVVVVKGYLSEEIDLDDVTYYTNEEYDSTNMVETLFCAEEEMDDGFVLSYSDIVFENQVLEGLMESDGDFVVTVDTDWQDYWEARYGRVDHDVESLSLEDGEVTELGVPDVSVDEIDGRYVGLMKFSDHGAELLKEVYHDAREEYDGREWQQSGNTFRNAYMTDLLQELIDRGYTVDAHEIQGGWLEFDTTEDYDKYQDWLETGEIDEFYEPV